MSKVTEIYFKNFLYKGRVASQHIFGNFYPAVFKKNDGWYSIRIIKGADIFKGTREWDYFSLDETGLIISSPRGLAKEFNKKVRIIDMLQAVELYKNEIVNEY
jgi:hypothetical protein